LVFSVHVGILRRVPQLDAANQPGYRLSPQAITPVCSVQAGNQDEDRSPPCPDAIKRTSMKSPDWP